ALRRFGFARFGFTRFGVALAIEREHGLGALLGALWRTRILDDLVPHLARGGEVALAHCGQRLELERTGMERPLGCAERLQEARHLGFLGRADAAEARDHGGE